MHYNFLLSFIQIIKMLADLLFIEDPRAKYKKNFYINDHNYNTKYSLHLRKTRKKIYNNSIKTKRLEQKLHPLPKILYSTAESFYRPKEKASQFLETQKLITQDLIDLMNRFTAELDNNEEKNKIDEEKTNIFITGKNSRFAKKFKTYNHSYISSKEKLLQDLEFAKATNLINPEINERQFKEIKNNEKLAKDNLVLDNNYGKYKFTKTGLEYPKKMGKYDLPNYDSKFGEDEEYFNYKKKVKFPNLVYNKINNFEEALNKDLEQINKNYGNIKSRARFSKNPLMKRYMEIIPLYEIYKDLKVIENRYIGSKYKFKLLPLYNKKLSNLDKLADNFYKVQNINGDLDSFIKISNYH